MTEQDLDLAGKLGHDERLLEEAALRNISPDDAKYRKASQKLADYLTADGEWRAFAYVQRVLLETRVEFGQAEKRHLAELDEALRKFSPLNASMLEDKVTKHDQLAVLEELGRFVSEETKSLLHPGTTSYDIVDTARSWLFKRAWYEVIRLEVAKSIEKLCKLSERSMDLVQVGRTHLQDTSPVLFGGVLAGYAARLAERVTKTDSSFNDLRGKVSGIVGTGAGIEMVIGEGRSIEFEKAVLDKLGLKPDYAATQVVQKERLADAGNSIVTLYHVLADFANDMRILYASAIKEVTSRDNVERLGGSSADATKNNPIDWENMAGKADVVESGMGVLYGMIQTDLQRDLRPSVKARFQPQAMMAETYEAFARLNKALLQLSVNEDRMRANLTGVRANPSEAMVAILRGEPLWVHSKYGLGHDFVKEMGKQAIKQQASLLDVALKDPEFRQVYDSLPEYKKDILDGNIERYVGSARKRAEINREYARKVASKT